jgi:hypothetical protein
MLTPKDKKQVKTGVKDKADRVRKKSAMAATNESQMAASLKNREHGNEQPAR